MNKKVEILFVYTLSVATSSKKDVSNYNRALTSKPFLYIQKLLKNKLNNEQNESITKTSNDPNGMNTTFNNKQRTFKNP